MQPLWYRNAVIYQVDVSMFFDSRGNGRGDLAGLTDRLEHIRGLGANCLWLLPFYKSRFRDGGYDVVDHLTVDPQFGDLADFAMLLDKADNLGLRVIIDLVVQHTSNEHPWFQEARRDPDSPYRGYYMWADSPHETGVSPVFPTVENDVWSWDEEAQQYYRHTFYGYQPDLELGNPRVRREIQRIMAFWLRMGVSGFRVDAVPYMVERARAADDRDDGHWLLEEMRDFVTLRRSDAVLLGEVDVPVKAYADYFGDGEDRSDRLTMLIDFWTNNHMFLSLARQDAGPLRDALRQQPPPPARGQYAKFLRNHDELDLEQLADDEREEVVGLFAPEESMQAYGRGIRRRLAPMLDGDHRRIAMAHALLASLPGAPVLLYGDEIGMGDDLSRSGRASVRTPMQWSDADNAGFSTAPADQLVAPVVTSPGFGYHKINVYAQSVGHDTLLARIGNLVRARTANREIGAGNTEVLDTDVPAVLALRHRMEDRQLITVTNLSGRDVAVKINGIDTGDLVDVLADQDYPKPGPVSQGLQLRGNGYRWLRPQSAFFG